MIDVCVCVCVRVSVDPRRGKYKNVKGTIAHKSQHIDNVPAVSQSVPRESNGFCVNRTHCAVVLNSPSGLVAVLAVS
jgi:coronin-7